MEATKGPRDDGLRRRDAAKASGHQRVALSAAGARNEYRRPKLPAEAARLRAGRSPDVQAIALDLASGVVDEEAAEVLLPDVDLQVSRQGKHPRVRGNDALSDV